MNDPFATAPAPAQAPAPAPVPDEAQQQYAPPAPQDDPWSSPPPEAAKPAPAPRPIVEGADGKVVLTFKGGTGFDAPWIVVHATDLDDALSYVNQQNGLKFQDLMNRVQNAAKGFAALGGGSAPAPQGGGQQQSNAPQAAQQAPNGQREFCSHGEMEFKSGVSKAGKPYSLFSCTVRDRNQQCKAKYLN